MFLLSNGILFACTSAIILIIIFTLLKYIRSKPMPKLIPAQARKYSVRASPVADQPVNSVEVPKLVEWARRPSQCAHHVGYLEKLPRTQSITSDCLHCYKIIKCLGSWRNDNNRENLISPIAT